jgi:hypothetical protein
MTPPAFSSDTIAKLHISAPSSLIQGSAGASGCAPWRPNLPSNQRDQLRPVRHETGLNHR